VIISALLFLWCLAFFAYLAYSYRYLHKIRLYQPLRFLRVRMGLAIAEFAALLALGTALIKREEIGWIMAIVIVDVSARVIVRRITYSRAVNEMALFQQRENDLSREDAIGVAKIMIDMQIHGSDS